MEERLASLKKDALSFANTLRKGDGRTHARSLAIGIRRHTSECPIVRTAGEGWEIGPAGAMKVGPRGGQKGPLVPVPESVRDFMAAFDSGMYPELDFSLRPTTLVPAAA